MNTAARPAALKLMDDLGILKISSHLERFVEVDVWA